MKVTRKLNSFLIRWWHGDGAERLELEHVQSGRKANTTSMQEAMGWLETQREANVANDSPSQVKADEQERK